MQMQRHDRAGVAGEVVPLVVRAARTLIEELRDARSLFDFQQHNLIDKVSKALATPEFTDRENEARLESLQELVTIMILQQVLGVETSLLEVYSDSGMVEYEIARTPTFTPKGVRLKKLDDALVDFRRVHLELAIRQQEARILEQHARR